MEENKNLEKYSYDELKNIASNLHAQLQMAKEQIAQLSTAIAKLPFLIKIVELENKFPQKFVNQCVDEIVAMLETPEEEVEDEKA